MVGWVDNFQHSPFFSKILRSRLPRDTWSWHWPLLAVWTVDTWARHCTRWCDEGRNPALGCWLGWRQWRPHGDRRHQTLHTLHSPRQILAAEARTEAASTSISLLYLYPDRHHTQRLSNWFNINMEETAFTCQIQMKSELFIIAHFHSSTYLVPLSY